MAIERIDPSGTPAPTPPQRPAGEKPPAAPTDSVQLSTGNASSGKKKWTVLVYDNGNAGTLQRLAPSVMRELEIAGSGDKLNIVAQVSRKKTLLDNVSKDWSGARRYYVEQNPNPPPMQEEIIRWFVPPYTKNIVSPVLQDMGTVDMGDPKTLEDFLHWGIQNYPAEHYAVVIYGQGGGFAGSVLDEKTGHAIENDELAGALHSAATKAGQKIDVVAFDANVISQIEVADQIKDAANIMVASEGTVALGSLALDMVMKDIKFEMDDGHPMTPEDVAKWFVFEARYQPWPMAEMMAPTLAAIKLDKVGDVKTAWGDVARALSQALAADPTLKEALREDIKATQSFVAPGKNSEPYEDFRDVVHFCEVLAADPRFNGNAALTAATANVVARAKDALLDEFHVKKMEHAHGISAYMPTDYGHDMSNTFFTPDDYDPVHGYGDTSVSKDTAWSEVLQTISKDTGFHEALKGVGVPPHVINKMEKIGGWGLTAAKTVLGIGQRAGHYEAYQAMRGNGPKNFIFIPASIATKIGIAGGVYEAFNGATKVFEAATNEELANPKTMLVDGAAGITTGAAVAATMIGMNVAQASGITRPAAIVAFAVPIAQSVYQLWAARNGAAQSRQAVADFTPREKLHDLARKQLADDKDFYYSPIVTAIAAAGSAGPMNVDKKAD